MRCVFAAKKPVTNKVRQCYCTIKKDQEEDQSNALLLAGVHTIAYAFPNVKIVTTAVDPEINEKFHVLPGIGNFGDR